MFQSRRQAAAHKRSPSLQGCRPAFGRKGLVVSSHPRGPMCVCYLSTRWRDWSRPRGVCGRRVLVPSRPHVCRKCFGWSSQPCFLEILPGHPRSIRGFKIFLQKIGVVDAEPVAPNKAIRASLQVPPKCGQNASRYGGAPAPGEQFLRARFEVCRSAVQMAGTTAYTYSRRQWQPKGLCVFGALVFSNSVVSVGGGGGVFVAMVFACLHVCLHMPLFSVTISVFKFSAAAVPFLPSLTLSGPFGSVLSVPSVRPSVRVLVGFRCVCPLLGNYDV